MPRKERTPLFLGLVGTMVKGRQEAGHSSSLTKAELEGEHSLGSILVARVEISVFFL
jgi:hypothetical protein